MTIEDIHVRYEDELTSQRASWLKEESSRFAAGFTLDRLEMKSFVVDKNANWRERFDVRPGRLAFFFFFFFCAFSKIFT